MLQSPTKLLEKVFPVMSTFLRNKTIFETTPLRKENPFPQFNVASHKRPGIRLSFEYTTTLLSGEGGEGRTGTATMFRKVLSKYIQFSQQFCPRLQYKFIVLVDVWLSCITPGTPCIRRMHRKTDYQDMELGMPVKTTA